MNAAHQHIKWADQRQQLNYLQYTLLDQENKLKAVMQKTDVFRRFERPTAFQMQVITAN